MTIKEKVSGFFAKCGRVWQILRKPGYEEFKNISKISAIGILIIGLIGFIISVVMTLF